MASAIGSQAYLVVRFTGDDDVSVEQFFETLELAKFLGTWSEEQVLAVAKLRLGGTAMEFIRSTPKAGETWATFQDKLKKRFMPRLHRYFLEQKFVNCKQGQTETVHTFSTRLRLIARQLANCKSSTSGQNVTDLPFEISKLEERIMHQFLVGLRTDLRRFVLVREPKSFEEALNAALLEEANDLVTGNYGAEAGAAPGAYAAVSAESLREQSAVGQGINKSFQDRGSGWQSSGQSSGQRVCYGCGESSHYLRDCPDYLCKHCLLPGHRPIMCPTLAKNTAVPRNE